MRSHGLQSARIVAVLLTERQENRVDAVDIAENPWL
jgi:hypothetical protein